MKRNEAEFVRRPLQALGRATEGAVLVEHVSVVAFMALIALAILLLVARWEIPRHSALRDSLQQAYP